MKKNERGQGNKASLLRRKRRVFRYQSRCDIISWPIQVTTNNLLAGRQTRANII